MCWLSSGRLCGSGSSTGRLQPVIADDVVTYDRMFSSKEHAFHRTGFELVLGILLVYFGYGNFLYFSDLRSRGSSDAPEYETDTGLDRPFTLLHSYLVVPGLL